MSIDPSTMGISPRIARNKVDFPDPALPIRAVKEPGPSPKYIPLSYVVSFLSLVFLLLLMSQVKFVRIIFES
jgi:hypothetical protein